MERLDCEVVVAPKRHPNPPQLRDFVDGGAWDVSEGVPWRDPVDDHRRAQGDKEGAIGWHDAQK